MTLSNSITYKAPTKSQGDLQWSRNDSAALQYNSHIATGTPLEKQVVCYMVLHTYIQLANRKGTQYTQGTLLPERNTEDICPTTGVS